MLKSSTTDSVHAKTVARWIRVMLPAALLVIAPVGAPVPDVPEDAISLDAQDTDSGPLSVADALVRAAAGPGSKDS